MLAGLQNESMGAPCPSEGIDMSVGRSMFDMLGRAPNNSPDPDEMAKAMERMRVDKHVDVKEVVARTYDLGDATQLNQYQYDLEILFIGMQLRTHVILQRTPLQFINDEKGPRYITHMQWIEFKLSETPVPIVSTAAKGDEKNDGKRKPGLET